MFNYDESKDLNSQQAWELLEDWEWDALTGRFQDYLIILRQERNTLRNAVAIARWYLDEPNEITVERVKELLDKYIRVVPRD